MKEPTLREEWAEAAGRVRDIQAVVPALSDLPEAGPASAPLLLCRLAAAVEALRRSGLRDQIQLVSLQEITESLLRSRDTDSALETLAVFLRQVLDLEEILLLRHMPAELGWAAVHANRQMSAAHSCGRIPDARIGPRLAAATAGASSSPDVALEILDPVRYAFVLPLGGSVEAGSTSDAEPGPGSPVGWLCLTPSALNPLDDTWQPLQIARRVEAILITLNHRAEMEEEARFRRQLLRAMRDGLLAIDRRERVVQCNAAAAELLGLPSTPTGAFPLSALEETAPALVRHLRRVMGEETEPSVREMTLSGGGEAIPVKVAISPLCREPGEIDGLVVNLTDLTEIREMENEIRRLDRLAVLGRFAAGMAHEIRNPLAGIEAGIEYLAMRMPDDSQDQEDVRMLRSEIHRLDRIVSDLLDYTRPRPLDPQPLDAAAVLERIHRTLAPLFHQRQVDWAAEGPAGLLFWADPDRLEQVLLNLVKNAAEASPQGGSVRISWERTSRGAARGKGRRRGEGSARRNDRPPEDESGNDLPGPMRFRISDQGPGMGSEELARAFEPFFTTKAKGTGLGLALSQTIVEQHGGRLLLESVAGRGTTVVLELPAGIGERRESDAVLHSHRG